MIIQKNPLPAGLRDRTILGESGDCFTETEIKERKARLGPLGIPSNPSPSAFSNNCILSFV